MQGAEQEPVPYLCRLCVCVCVSACACVCLCACVVCCGLFVVLLKYSPSRHLVPFMRCTQQSLCDNSTGTASLTCHTPLEFTCDFQCYNHMSAVMCNNMGM